MKRPALQRLATVLFACSLLPIGIEANAQDGGPVTAGKVKTAIQALEEQAQKQIDTNAVPGLAIAVVFEDGLLYAKGFGVKDTGTGDPVDADTVFQLASLSKPIGSTIVAALVGDGKITWDSRISDLDPGFEMHVPWVTPEITIRDFFCHRSGLPEHTGDLLEAEAVPAARHDLDQLAP